MCGLFLTRLVVLLVLTTLLDDCGHVFGAVIDLTEPAVFELVDAEGHVEIGTQGGGRASPRELAPADGLALIIEDFERVFSFSHRQVNEELGDAERVIDERGAGFSVPRARTVERE